MHPAVSIVLQAIFWLSFLGIVHTYFVYPFLVKFLARNKKPNQQTYPLNGKEWPNLVVVMAAYNEEAVIGDTLKSIFESDYPVDRMEIFLGSDNSTDGTHAIVEKFQAMHSNLNLKVFEGRCGKIRIVNQLIEDNRELLEQKGDYVLIMCDANVCWSPPLAKQLAKHFKNPKIGQVASNVVDCDVSGDGIAEEEDAYVNRENFVKYCEGMLWGRMMGAFGACYAMRGRLFEPIPENFNVDDFYQTMRTFELGYEAVVELDAICYEAVSQDIREEFRRKKRISTGNFQNLKRFFLFLQPWRCGMTTFFAFWSHKGLRWFGPFLLIAMFLSAGALAVGSWFYLLALAGMGFSIIAASLDGILDKSGIHLRALRFVRYFYLMNLALLLGAVKFCSGVSNSVWEPTQRVIPNQKPEPSGSES